MPKRTIEVYLYPTEAVVEAEFKSLYGGSDANWNWLRRRLETIDPDELRRRCEKLPICDLV